MAQEFAPVQPGDRITARVTHVTDGDSLVVTLRGLRVAVRLAGINCPEWDAPGGQAATEFTTAWVKCGATVDLEVAQDCYTNKPNSWDKHGRLLAFIWRDGEMLNEVILRGGHAQVKYIRKTGKYYERLVTAKK